MQDERLSTLVISETHRTAIRTSLDRMMSESDARCAMLLDISGVLLGFTGEVPPNKAESLSVLLANGFVAARQVASILGQPQFEAFLQQGKEQHILSEAIGNHWILVTIFEDRTSEGLVRLLSGRTVRELRPTLQLVRDESAAYARGAAARAAAPGQKPRLDSLNQTLDNLFGDRPG